MNTCDDGGTAFPADATTNLFSRGMTLRDYFAGVALAVVAQIEPVGFRYEERCATQAYAMADAMLKARQQ